MLTKSCIGIVFLIAAVIDGRRRVIPDALPIGMLVIGTVSCLTQGIPLHLPLLNGGMFLLLLLSIALIGDASLHRKGIDGCALGGGDIKLLSATAYTMGAFITLFLTSIALLLALIYKWIKVRKTNGVLAVPLAPFFLVGYAVVLVMSFLLKFNQ